jgi:4-oxalocrotonate tautomerase family enzyme
MPVVNVEMWPMKEEMKSEVIKKITDSFVELGIPAEAVTVIIHETSKSNWGSAGVQHSIKFKD